jgi:translation initiation factor 6
MHFARMNIQNNPYIGLFCFAADEFCLTNHFVSEKNAKAMKDILKVPVIKTSIMGTSLAGIFAIGNSKGIIIPGNAEESEIKFLKSRFNVLVLNTRHTAVGNLILANDKGCLISEKLEKYSGLIKDFLGVKVKTGTISGSDFVGSLGICNNKGCLVHKKIENSELKVIETLLDVRAGIGTVNFGNSWIKSGLITNSNGFIAGDQTTGPELGNVNEVLGFL